MAEKGQKKTTKPAPSPGKPPDHGTCCEAMRLAVDRTKDSSNGLLIEPFLHREENRPAWIYHGLIYLIPKTKPFDKSKLAKVRFIQVGWCPFCGKKLRCP